MHGRLRDATLQLQSASRVAASSPLQGDNVLFTECFSTRRVDHVFADERVHTLHGDDVAGGAQHGARRVIRQRVPGHGAHVADLFRRHGSLVVVKHRREVDGYEVGGLDGLAADGIGHHGVRFRLGRVEGFALRGGAPKIVGLELSVSSAGTCG